MKPGNLSMVLVALSGTLFTASDVRGQCGGEWTSAAGTGPSPRQNHAMVYDSSRNRVVLFGGYRGGFGFYDDTWEWDGEAWNQVPAVGPLRRGNHVMAYDSLRQRVVLFGGATDGGAAIGDTWEYDGATQTWTELFPTAPPVPRFNAAMTFDSVRNVAVLFGGFGAARYGDTWTWDGANWVQVATTGATGRNGHAMAFDPAHGVVVLFGGFNGQRLGDTWEWNGASWSQRATTGPTPRQHLAIAYHADRERVMLFGGQTGPCSTCREDDTWDWDGNAWTLLSDAGATFRDQHAMVFDAARHQLLLFGGYAGSALVLDDSWQWRATFLAADLDQDGVVGIQDLTILLAHYGVTSGASPADGDLDGDTDVDINDLTLMLSAYGTSCP
jgi:hypothetical protein